MTVNLAHVVLSNAEFATILRYYGQAADANGRVLFRRANRVRSHSAHSWYLGVELDTITLWTYGGPYLPDATTIVSTEGRDVEKPPLWVQMQCDKEGPPPRMLEEMKGMLKQSADNMAQLLVCEPGFCARAPVGERLRNPLFLCEHLK